MERSTQVSLLLSQYAQVLPNGIVNIMGGGMTVIPPKVPVIFIAGAVRFGWGAIGSTIKVRIELLDENGSAVTTDEGEPVFVEAEGGVSPAPGFRSALRCPCRSASG